MSERDLHGLRTRLRDRAASPRNAPGASPGPRSSADVELALCELQVRQAELERQNAELRRAQLELRASRDALAHSERHYRNLYENAPLAYLTLASDGHIAAANHVAKSLIGAGQQSLVGRRFSDFVAPDHQDTWHRTLRALLRGRALRPLAINLEASAGSTLRVELVGSAGSEPGKLHIALLDVTEREAASQAARDSERRVRLITDALPVLVAYVDDEERYRFVNAAYETWFGEAPAALRGRQIREVLGEAAYAALSEHARAALSGTPVRYESEVRYRSAGSRYVSAVYSPDIDDSGAVVGFYSVVHDLTALRRAQDALRAAAAEAALAEQRERRALAADLHDDVGQLLSLASIELAAQGDAKTPEQRQALLDQAAALVADARERVASLSFELSPPILHDVGIVAAAQWLAEDLERRYGLAVRVDARDDGLTPLDEALRITLFRALRELLINVARHAGTADARVRIRCEDDGAEIEVEDAGVGFDPGAVNRGFGLRSVCDRVEHMGGSVRVVSSPGEGTRIRVRAPIGRARERGGS